jgi:hypothetical protein
LEGEALSKEEGRPIGHEILYSWSKPILRWWDSKTAPNFVAAWSLLDDLQLLQPWPDPEKKKTMWWEVYYGVYFFAWLDSLAD